MRVCRFFVDTIFFVIVFLVAFSLGLFFSAIVHSATLIEVPHVYADPKIYNPVSIEDLLANKSLYDGHRIVVAGVSVGVEKLAGRTSGSEFYRMGVVNQDLDKGLQALQESVFSGQGKGNKVLVFGVYHEFQRFHGLPFSNWIEVIAVFPSEE